MNNKHLIKIISAAVFAALTCVCTIMISVPLPGGGFANLGDTLVIISGFFLGPVYGFCAAAIGSALADIILTYTVYAPATFVIKGLMALTVALLTRGIAKKLSVASSLRIAASSVIAEVIMVGGYFVFEIFLLGAAPAAADIPGNLIQGAFGLVLSALVINVLTANKKLMSLVPSKQAG